MTEFRTEIINEIDDPEGDLIGFTCGAMDLFHAGHVLMLKEAADECDHLIVGLHTDPTIDRPSKNKPIQSLDERRIQLEACAYVDAIIEYDTEEHLVEILQGLYDEWGENFVRFIGMDWKGKPYTGHELPIMMYYNQRDHGFSSSELRKRIYEAEKKKEPRVIEPPHRF